MRIRIESPDRYRTGPLLEVRPNGKIFQLEGDTELTDAELVQALDAALVSFDISPKNVPYTS